MNTKSHLLISLLLFCLYLCVCYPQQNMWEMYIKNDICLPTCIYLRNCSIQTPSKQTEIYTIYCG